MFLIYVYMYLYLSRSYESCLCSQNIYIPKQQKIPSIVESINIRHIPHPRPPLDRPPRPRRDGLDGALHQLDIPLGDAHPPQPAQVPDGRRRPPLAHDGGEGDKLRLDGGQDLVVRQEQAVDDGALHPLKVRPERAPRGEDGRQVLPVYLLQESGAAVGDGGVEVDVFSGIFVSWVCVTNLPLPPME